MPEHSEDIEKTFIVNPAASAPAEFVVGQVVEGKYKVISLLGAGGIGSVYKVEQIFLRQLFALKTLNTQKASDQMIRRFHNEARTASALNHPNLVKVNDFGLVDGQQPYLVMDYVDGVTLGEFVRKNGVLNLEQVVACFSQICLGLSYAHDQGVVHRDIKLSNIMISTTIPFGEEGFVKVVDFGIAKLAYAEDGDFQALTNTGEIFGSPLYMSPEQCSGLAVDYRSDIYSLGCVLFEVLTGTTPFVGQNALATMMLHQTQPVPSLKEASLGKDFPPELEILVQKLLSKSPADRYQNLGVVANDLAQIYKGAPVLGIAAAPQKPVVAAATVTMTRSKFQTILLLTFVLTAAFAGTAGYFAGSSTKKSVSTLSGPKEAPASPAEQRQTVSAENLVDQGVNRAFEYEDYVRKKHVIEKQLQSTLAKVQNAKPNDREVFLKSLEELQHLHSEASKNKKLASEFLPLVEVNQVICNLRLGKFESVEEQLAQKLKKKPHTADEMNKIATVYQQMSDCKIATKDVKEAFRYLKKSSDYFCEAVELAGSDEKQKNIYKISGANVTRVAASICHQWMNDNKQTIELANKARRLLEGTSDNYLKANALLILAAAQSREKQYDEARKNLISSNRYLMQLNNKDFTYDFDRICANLELANLELQTGNKEASREYLLKARNTLDSAKPLNKDQVLVLKSARVDIENRLSAVGQ